MWIARDKSGEVYLYVAKPIRGIVCFYYHLENYGMTYLGREEIYPEVTWENSPKQVELKIIE